MYNIKMKEKHPSTICVLLSKFEDSLKSMIDVVTSPLVDESLEEFIEEYARTDEIMPEDKTIGFIIINKDKKVISITFTQNMGINKKNVEDIIKKYEELGYKAEIEYANTPF